MRIITPMRGERDTQTDPTKECLSQEEAEFFLGPHFRVLILLSGDYLLVSENWKNYDETPINKNATAIVGEPIYGPVILLEPDEFDFQEFRRKGGLQVTRKGV